MDLINLVKEKVVLHVTDSDLDGVSCRLIAEYFLAPHCKEYIPLNTADRSMTAFNWDIAGNSDIILFTDIAPSNLEMYNKLVSMNKQVIICDHHITAKDYLKDIPNYFYSDNFCATKILYDLITEGKRKYQLINDYVTLVNVYDTWKQESPIWLHAKALHNCLMGMISWFTTQTDTQRSNKFLEKQLQKFNSKPTQKFFFDIYEQTIIKKANLKEENNYKMAKKNLQKRVDNQGNKYILTECTSKVSFVASRLLKEFKDYAYIAIRATFVKDAYKFSLRSNNGFKVSSIAEKFGGGGHEAAAGLELTQEQYFNFKSGKIHLL